MEERFLQGIKMKAINRCQDLLEKGVRYISASPCDFWYWHSTTSDTGPWLPPAFRTPFLRKEQFCYKKQQSLWIGVVVAMYDLCCLMTLASWRITDPNPKLGWMYVFYFYLWLFCIIMVFSKGEKIFWK